jgi:hypothetical protein
MLTIILAGQLQWHIWISHAVRVKRPWVNSDCIKQGHQTPRKHAQRIKKASKIVKKSTTLRIIGAIFLFGIILFGAAINHTGPAIVLAFFGLGIAYEYFVVWPQVKREKATAASQADAVK